MQMIIFKGDYKKPVVLDIITDNYLTILNIGDKCWFKGNDYKVIDKSFETAMHNKTKMLRYLIKVA